MTLTRRGLAALAALATLPARAQPAGWDGIAARARGQTVAFNAWAGDERTNAFIAWAAERVQALHGITLRHVRLRDTGEVAEISRVWCDGSTSTSSAKGFCLQPSYPRWPSTPLCAQSRADLRGSVAMIPGTAGQ